MQTRDNVPAHAQQWATPEFMAALANAIADPQGPSAGEMHGVDLKTSKIHLQNLAPSH